MSVTTFAGPRYSNFALLPNSTNCPQGTTWDANGQVWNVPPARSLLEPCMQGCICPQGSACTGPQYNQFQGPYSGCRAGQFEVTPGACAGSNSPTWNPALHPDCEYPRQFFDFNCTTCQCVPWGRLCLCCCLVIFLHVRLVAFFDPSTAATVNFAFNAVHDLTSLTSAVNAITYPNGGSMLSIGLQKIANQVFNVSNGARPTAANITRVLVVLTDGIAQYQFGPEVGRAHFLLCLCYTGIRITQLR